MIAKIKLNRIKENSIVENLELKRLTMVIQIFNQLFAESENTLLVSGAKEPFYKASTKDSKAKIHSREDYLSSALHEMAHWTIAGEKRRQIDDFGYWYEEEGRTLEQQLQFEQVEIKPQAIEWLLSLACNQPFYFSADNLSQETEASEYFKQAVYRQAVDFLKYGLPYRGKILFEEIVKTFRDGVALSAKELEIENA
ncbi:MAG: diaminobutyrate-2-oxoglutarate aminotransferase [Gammaproteobacteria bacterium]|nr:MAG: diaminobutyrate-2-oxoglutarate aminotransferase [Gammaproteobacteria bacterium]